MSGCGLNASTPSKQVDGAPVSAAAAEEARLVARPFTRHGPSAARRFHRPQRHRGVTARTRRSADTSTAASGARTESWDSANTQKPSRSPIRRD